MTAQAESPPAGAVPTETEVTPLASPVTAAGVRFWPKPFVPQHWTPNRFAVAVPTQAPKALYVTAAVSASLGRPARFGPATVL